MKQLTQEEKTLLNALELHASRMSNIQAVLDLLADSCPFSYEEDGNGMQRALRLRAVRVIESVSHLAQFYHDDSMHIVDGYYHADR